VTPATILAKRYASVVDDETIEIHPMRDLRCCVDAPLNSHARGGFGLTEL
jgi:hypothetical protein